MAQAKHVRAGQVWTARVSGRDVQVEILSEVDGTSSGRKRFLYKNLATGRQGKGTAGKLRKLVRDASPHGDPAAVVPPPTPRRSRYPGKGHDNCTHECNCVVQRGSFMPCSLCQQCKFDRQRSNPTHYPSAAAEAACVALSRSNAQTPHAVMAVVDHTMRQLVGRLDPQEERRRSRVNPHEIPSRVLPECYSTAAAAMRRHGAIGVKRTRSGWSPVVQA